MEAVMRRWIMFFCQCVETVMDELIDYNERMTVIDSVIGLFS